MVSRCIYAASQVYIILLFQHRLPGRSSGHQLWPLTAPQKQFNADECRHNSHWHHQWLGKRSSTTQKTLSCSSVCLLCVHGRVHADQWGDRKHFLPARRYASAGNSDRYVSVCLSVRPSVTRRYCVKSKKASVMISSPSGSPKTLVLWRQISSPNSKGFPPNGGLKEGSVGKIQRFLPARRYASAGNSDRNVSVCLSVCLSVRHAPVLCQNEES